MKRSTPLLFFAWARTSVFHKLFLSREPSGNNRSAFVGFAEIVNEV